MAQRGFRSDGSDDPDEVFFAPGRPPCPEADLWVAVVERQLADAKLGLKALHGQSGGAGTLYSGRLAAVWLLDRRSHGLIVEGILGIDLGWFAKILKRAFGDDLERLAAVKFSPSRPPAERPPARPPEAQRARRAALAGGTSVLSGDDRRVA